MTGPRAVPVRRARNRSMIKAYSPARQVQPAPQARIGEGGPFVMSQTRQAPHRSPPCGIAALHQLLPRTPVRANGARAATSGKCILPIASIFAALLLLQAAGPEQFF